MITRLLLNDLQDWKNRSNRKPLIIRGARQVGKTTLVNEFAKEFPIYLKLNLEMAADKNLFDQYQDIHELVKAIYFFNKAAIENTLTLLFIDEIQNSPKAVAMLRYFYEEYPQIHIIAAGSLLETMLNNQQISFPVGRVEFLALRSCNFLEFLNGVGEDFDANLIKNLQVDPVHDRVMKLFNAYALIGGMPAAVVQYAENKDVLSVTPIYESLIESYKDDAEKYSVNNTNAKVIRHILKTGWGHAAETISFENFGGGGFKSRETGTAFRIIEKALLLELVYPTPETKLPILPDYKKKPKLIWLDTGLVNYAAGIQDEVFSVKNIHDAWRGRIAEQIVAQEIISLDNRVSASRNFWRRNKSGSEAEIDFIHPFNGKLIPVEVKSGHNAHLRSLHMFMEMTNHDIAVRIWSKPLSIDKVKTKNNKEFKLINLPYYYLPVLNQVLSQYIR